MLLGGAFRARRDFLSGFHARSTAILDGFLASAKPASWALRFTASCRVVPFSRGDDHIVLFGIRWCDLMTEVTSKHEAMTFQKG